jgi:hypothetical protein
MAEVVSAEATSSTSIEPRKVATPAIRQSAAAAPASSAVRNGTRRAAEYRATIANSEG